MPWIKGFYFEVNGHLNAKIKVKMIDNPIVALFIYNLGINIVKL